MPATPPVPTTATSAAATTATTRRGARTGQTTPRSKGRTGRPWRRLVAQTFAVRPLICWLCGSEIDPDLPYRNPFTGHPNPDYKTVHHIIPISRGGAELDPKNCVPAHSICNQRAGDKMPWELPGRQQWVVSEDP